VGLFVDWLIQLLFQSIAVESLGPMHESARQFLVDCGRKITDRSGDEGEGSLLFQRILVLLHHFNSVLLQPWWRFAFSECLLVACLLACLLIGCLIH